MFFVLSKTVGIFAQPSNVALTLIGLALLLRLLRRRQRWQRWLLRIGLGMLVVFSVPLCSQAMLYPLEAPYRGQRPALKQAPVAIVMLTGVLDNPPDASTIEFNDSADRLIEAVRLAHHYPEAKLLILGGSAALILDGFREGSALAKLARELGIDGRRIIVDPNSRNTHENAVNGAKLLAPLPPGEVLLVTSAFHMRRSMACFKKSLRDGKHHVRPWAVDFRQSSIRHDSFIPRWYGLRLAEQLSKEYLGYIAYWLAGYV